MTQATALLAGAKDPWWDEHFERTVVCHTTHADPRLRAAAYRTLGQRDPDLWGSAMLVHVAEFDPDPLVQREAPRSGR